MSFYVIDTETLGEHQRSKTAIGPFVSRKAAEQFLREDCEQTFLESDASLRDCNADEWSAPMLIVQVVSCVRPRPTASVKVALRKVKGSK